MAFLSFFIGVDAMSNADLPAMVSVSDKSGFIESNGLTKREYFAGLAMQGIISYSGEGSPNGLWEVVAKDAVIAADALLSELEKQK